MADREITYVAQILAGSHCSYRSHVSPGGLKYGCGSISGGGELERFIEDYAADIVDGAWVVDGRNVDPSDAVRVSVRGPMVDADGELDSEGWNGEHYAPIGADPMGGHFVAEIAENFGMSGMVAAQELTARAADPEPGPLDYASPAYIARLWQSVGARVGRWHRHSDDAVGGVVWES